MLICKTFYLNNQVTYMFRVKENGSTDNIMYSFWDVAVEKLGTQVYQNAMLKYDDILTDLVVLP